MLVREHCPNRGMDSNFLTRLNLKFCKFITIFFFSNAHMVSPFFSCGACCRERMADFTTFLGYLYLFGFQ